MKTLHCDVQERAMQCVFQINYTFVTQALRTKKKKENQALVFQKYLY